MVQRLWRDRGFGIAMLTFFAISLVLQWIAGWQEYVSEQTDHGFAIQVGEYVWREISATMENWQSEFLQLFTQVALLTYLLWKGSPQSKDSDEEAMNAIRETQEEVRKLREALERR
jgi:hypothetical protein